jgi:hypothetical protein
MLIYIYSYIYVYIHLSFDMSFSLYFLELRSWLLEYHTVLFPWFYWQVILNLIWLTSSLSLPQCLRVPSFSLQFSSFLFLSNLIQPDIHKYQLSEYGVHIYIPPHFSKLCTILSTLWSATSLEDQINKSRFSGHERNSWFC